MYSTVGTNTAEKDLHTIWTRLSKTRALPKKDGCYWKMFRWLEKTEACRGGMQLHLLEMKFLKCTRNLFSLRSEDYRKGCPGSSHKCLAKCRGNGTVLTVRQVMRSHTFPAGRARMPPCITAPHWICLQANGQAKNTKDVSWKFWFHRFSLKGGKQANLIFIELQKNCDNWRLWGW